MPRERLRKVKFQRSILTLDKVVEKSGGPVIPALLLFLNAQRIRGDEGDDDYIIF